MWRCPSTTIHAIPIVHPFVLYIVCICMQCGPLRALLAKDGEDHQDKVTPSRNMRCDILLYGRPKIVQKSKSPGNHTRLGPLVWISHTRAGPFKSPVAIDSTRGCRGTWRKAVVYALVCPKVASLLRIQYSRLMQLGLYKQSKGARSCL